MADQHQALYPSSDSSGAYSIVNYSRPAIVTGNDSSTNYFIDDHIPKSQINSHSTRTVLESPGQQPLKPWIWEISACLFSLICIGAVIIVLAYENGKPLDLWAWRIGPTAVVSFIATLSKSSLLLPVAEAISQLKWQHYDGKTNALKDIQTFDNASRGPVGAITLIFKQHIRARLASLASLVVIIALFMDPFMQLVFTFPALSIQDPNETGSFNQTKIYDPNGNIMDEHMTASGAAAMDASMQAAIIGAVSNPSNSLAASCTSGNCTWPDITTLGICASCNNITQLINVACPRGGRRAECHYTMPSGKNLSGIMFEAGATADFFPTLWNSTATGLRLSSKYGSSAGLAHIEAVQLKADFDYENFDLYSIIDKPTAWECNLEFCTKTYKSITMNNGVLSSAPPVEAPLFVTNNTIVFNATGGISPMQGFSSNSTPADSGEFYWLNDLDWSNMDAYLTQVFSWGWGEKGFGVSNQIASATAPNLGQWFAESANLDQTLSDMAEKMTEVIRNSRNSTLEVGAAFRTRVYIQVEWAWLALPIALAVVSLILVITMVVRTARSDVPAWKSSNLALLLYQIDGWSSEARGPLGPSVVKDRAKDIHVTLPRGWDRSTFVAREDQEKQIIR